MTATHALLMQKIATKKARVGIIGLGYVGLPLARTFSAGGISVLGFDIDVQKVQKLEAGESYIGHIAADDIVQMRQQGFESTHRFERLREVDAVLICVPTPLTDTREPNLQFVIQSSEAVRDGLRPGQLVVLESTTYPGTTREVVLPILEQTGLRVGDDFFLAFSPEREDPGNAFYSTAQIPKVVGGLDSSSLEIAAALYQQVVVRVVKVSTAEVAEACKILENTYRCVNIALVNELKMLFDRMGIDIWEVIEAAKSKPFGFAPFYPGPGMGGHCIPIDPFYLAWVARKHRMSVRFIELAGEVNTAMPHYVVERTSAALNERGKPLRGSRICVLGVAYKKDVEDPRESPAFHIIESLLAAGAVVTYHDPYVPELPKMRHHALPSMTSHALTPFFLRSQDCVLVITDHSNVDYSLVVEHADLIVDTRNAIRARCHHDCHPAVRAA
jgi:UDP-N-acetyl-D-glucosamine dehydrogenase